MPYNRDRRHRHSIRLRGYDYSQAGGYFITICTQDKAELFGEITDGNMRLNERGEIVHSCWADLPKLNARLKLDSFVIMPDHVHGIMMIVDPCRDGSRIAPNRKPIGRIIGAFKTASTHRINDLRNTPGVRMWQRNYYEHIIRNEHELNRIRKYIENNPRNWGRRGGYGSKGGSRTALTVVAALTVIADWRWGGTWPRLIGG